MVITKKILHELSDKYQLDFDKFKFVDKKNFFKKLYFIFYSHEEYFFQINKNNEDLKNFFPYFAQSNEITNIEAWVKSIFYTENKKNKIVSDLKTGLKKRNYIKKKYNI